MKHSSIQYKSLSNRVNKFADILALEYFDKDLPFVSRVYGVMLPMPFVCDFKFGIAPFPGIFYRCYFKIPTLGILIKGSNKFVRNHHFLYYYAIVYTILFIDSHTTVGTFNQRRILNQWNNDT